MDPHDIDHQPEQALTRFIAAGLEADSVWKTEDLVEMLTHQLALPLDQELSLLPGVNADDVASLTEQADPTLRSFHDLFLHPNPPYLLLEHVKLYTKIVRSNAQDPVLEQIVSLVYYACIAVALLKHDSQLSTLDHSLLHDGLLWSRSRPWVAPSLIELFDQAAQRLNPHNESQG